MQRPSSANLAQVRRFLEAGVANTIFGFSLYSLFILVGIQMYLAQIVCQMVGVAFAYVTYSRHVFADARASRLRFVMAYALHYLVGLGTLSAAIKLWRSPYGAGLVAILIAAAFNFIVLRRFVFAPAPETAHA